MRLCRVARKLRLVQGGAEHRLTTWCSLARGKGRVSGGVHHNEQQFVGRGPPYSFSLTFIPPRHSIAPAAARVVILPTFLTPACKCSGRPSPLPRAEIARIAEITMRLFMTHLVVFSLLLVSAAAWSQRTNSLPCSGASTNTEAQTAPWAPTAADLKFHKLPPKPGESLEDKQLPEAEKEKALLKQDAARLLKLI